MNNKSTENLIESSESVEELHIPPLDLKCLNNDKKPLTYSNRVNSDSDHSLNTEPKRAQKNFLVEKSSLNEPTQPKSNAAPVPAVRKFSLPPIATERNGKGTKENTNQFTRKRSIQNNDTVQMVSERTNQPQNDKLSSGDSESNSGIHQLKELLTDNKINRIELKAFAAQTKNHLKSPFRIADINEETTSFVSYEEKHEQEDNSEHSASNQSSVNDKELRKVNDVDGSYSNGVKNEAFVQHPDDNVVVERPSIGSNSKSKKKDKKSKIAKKSKEERKKRSSRRDEQTITQVEINESEDDHQNSYDFKKVIGNVKMMDNDELKK